MSKNFSDVFQELVPNGKGQLIMKRAEEVVRLVCGGERGGVRVLFLVQLPSVDTEDEDSARPSASGSSSRGTSVDEQFTGVSIRVSSPLEKPVCFTLCCYMYRFHSRELHPRLKSCSSCLAARSLWWPSLSSLPSRSVTPPRSTCLTRLTRLSTRTTATL